MDEWDYKTSDFNTMLNCVMLLLFIYKCIKYFNGINFMTVPEKGNDLKVFETKCMNSLRYYKLSNY